MSKNLLVSALAGLFILSNRPGWADNPNVYPNDVPTPVNTAAVASPDAAVPPTDSNVDPKEAALTPDQLDTLVAPIALYPDTLVSQILVASTYPLEIVQAAQWLDQNSTLKGTALTTAAQQQSWDASIQALVVFPDVIKRLAQDVTWTTNLGNAFLARQGDVMDSVQRMRGKAEQSGKLKSTEQQKVTTTTDQGQKVIEIQPTNPEVVYVPYYDPVVIWGPPAYYAYPEWDYPPRPYGAYFWYGSGVSMGFYYGSGWRSYGGWGWHPGWHDRTVVVNNTFIQHYNYHTNIVVTHGTTAVWHHDSVHRMGVAYPNRTLGSQYRPAVYARPHPNVAQVQTQFHASAVRSETFHNANGIGRPAAVDHFGHRDIPANGYNRNHSAFGGVNQGAARTQVYSQRGNASLSHMARPVGRASRGIGNVGGHGPVGVGSGGGHTSGGFSGGGEGHGSGHGR